MDFPIIYEDGYFYILDKPSGVVVNRADSVKGETVQDWVERKSQISSRLNRDKIQIDEENRDFFERSGIVHRLDKETSGLLIIAKNPQSFVVLQSLFKERKIHKQYIALVHGKVTPQQADISASVGRLPWNRERFGVLAGGKQAHTSYYVLNYYTDGVNFYTYLYLTPTTGRTHQIRIHLKYIGHPIVSDKFYVGRKTFRADSTFCSRLFLHAIKLQFVHPFTPQNMEIESKLPDALNTVLNHLRMIH